MQLPRTDRSSAARHVAPTLMATLLLASASAQERPPLDASRQSAPDATHAPTPPASIAASAPFRTDDVLFDAPGDGSLWALGATYKVGFEAGSATFYPSFGPDAPKNYPHHLSPEVASLGGNALAFARDAAPVRHDRRVELDRGAFVEVYDLDMASLEQSFVFAELPERGELLLRIPVGSELEGLSSAAGIRFRGPFGDVTYGRATAIDAAGRRQDAPTELVGGAIEIRVAAEFVATAALPLVIDPVVAGVPINTTTDDSYSPDVAWEPFDLVWLAVYERVHSATDTDILARFVNAAGTTISEDGIDLTGVAWKRPRTANLVVAKQFLVVAEVTSGSSTIVRGRTVESVGPSIISMGPQFTISDSSTGNKVLPDVGGDPYEIAPAFYCVVYEQQNTSSDSRIVMRLVAPDSTLPTSPTFLTPPGFAVNTTPSISNSNNALEWLVAWTRNFSLSAGDIYASRVRWDGAVLDGPLEIVSGPAEQILPCASTALAGTNLSAIACQGRVIGLGTTADILVVLLEGSIIRQIVSLQTLEGTGTASQKQTQASIDSNGSHFLVGYSEFDAVFGHDELFVTDLYVTGTEFGVSQPHVTLQLWGVPQNHARVAAQHSTSVGSKRFLVGYDLTQNSVNHDVVAHLFDVFAGGTSTAFCFGDGTGTACPCSNAGGPGRGCANGSSPSGALLALNGTPSTVEDSAVLDGSGLPNNATCLFFQGTSSNSGFPFGDGVRCVNGIVLRLGIDVATGGTTSFPPPGGSLHVTGQIGDDGGSRTYQLWYRDTASFCTPSAFNITNGVLVEWAR